MLDFAHLLTAPTPLYECANVVNCPNGTYRTAESFSWWDISSLVYTPNQQFVRLPTHETPWQHQVLYPINTNRRPPNWWCNHCIQSLENFAPPRTTTYIKVPMQAWLNRYNQEYSQGQFDLTLTTIRPPQPSYQCGHPKCKLIIPPEELTHCKIVHIDNSTDIYIPPHLNHPWLCPEHTDELYAQLPRNHTMTIQVGPTLLGLLDLRNQNPG